MGELTICVSMLLGDHHGRLNLKLQAGLGAPINKINIGTSGRNIS